MRTRHRYISRWNDVPGLMLMRCRERGIGYACHGLTDSTSCSRQGHNGRSSDSNYIAVPIEWIVLLTELYNAWLHSHSSIETAQHGVPRLAEFWLRHKLRDFEPSSPVSGFDCSPVTLIQEPLQPLHT